MYSYACVIPSLIVVVNKGGGWRSKKTKMPLGFIRRFLMPAWNKRIYVYAASLVGRKRNEVVMEWIKLCVLLDVRGIYVRHSVAKVVFAVWREKRWSHREFVVLIVSGRSVNVSRKCCPEVKSLGVGVEFCIAVDIDNFGGDVKLFLCVAYWNHLIHIQLGTLGLKKIDARGP